MIRDLFDLSEIHRSNYFDHYYIIVIIGMTISLECYHLIITKRSSFQLTDESIAFSPQALAMIDASIQD